MDVDQFHSTRRYAHDESVELVAHFDLAAEPAGRADVVGELEHVALRTLDGRQAIEPCGVDVHVTRRATHHAAAFADDTGHAVRECQLHQRNAALSGDSPLGAV